MPTSVAAMPSSVATMRCSCPAMDTLLSAMRGSTRAMPASSAAMRPSTGSMPTSSTSYSRNRPTPPPPSPPAAFSKEKSSQRPPAGYFAARVTIDLHDPGTPPTPDPTPPLSPPPEIISANGSTPSACRPTFSLPICAIRARTNIPCHPHSSKTHTSVAYMDVHKPTPLSVIH